MILLYSSVILLTASVAYISIAKRNRTDRKKLSAQSDASPYQWSVYIKDNGQVYKDYEDDDFNKVGHRIYTKLEKPNQSCEIYIQQNPRKELMWINKDYESEYMIGVDNHEGRRIAYLPFSKVASM